MFTRLYLYGHGHDHTHRPRLKGLFDLELSRGSRRKFRFCGAKRHTAVSEAKRPARSCFRIKAAMLAATGQAQIYNGCTCIAAISERTQTSVRVQRLCNGRGRWPKPAAIFIKEVLSLCHSPSSQTPRHPGAELATGGLACSSM
jgi:hypothetical protein